MVTGLKQNKVKSIKVHFSSEQATSFGGLALAERLGLRLGLWTKAQGALGERAGVYDWLTVVKSAVGGLLTQARGTYATEAIRAEECTQKVLGLDGAPEEATFWRCLGQLGGAQKLAALDEVLRSWAVRVLQAVRRKDVLFEGFVPVFADGSLLEGSSRREGTKYLKDKGTGLVWTTVFVGPFLAGQRLCAPGQGEQGALESMLDEVVDGVLRPLRWKRRALWLMDSLHGDGPSLDRLETRKQRYVVGANKLQQTQRVLAGQPEAVWEDTGARTKLGWDESAVCLAYVQCEGWARKRLLVGRRWRRSGQMFYDYAGVLTNLTENDLEAMRKRGLSFARAVWRLYDYKAGCENYYKDLLEDLGLHHPPCEQHHRNAAFYALGALAHTLGRAVDLIGGRGEARGKTTRKDGAPRKRPTPRRMRLWRLIRTLFVLPARVRIRARTAHVDLFQPSPQIAAQYRRYWLNVCQC